MLLLYAQGITQISRTRRMDIPPPPPANPAFSLISKLRLEYASHRIFCDNKQTNALGKPPDAPHGENEVEHAET